MQRIVFAPLIGFATENVFTDVVTNEARNLICVFAVQGGDQAMDQAAEETAPSSFSALRDLVKQFSAELHVFAPASVLEFYQRIEQFVQHVQAMQGTVQLSAGFFYDDRSALLTLNGAIFLKRETKTGKILSSNEEMKIVEGSRHEQDVFVFATLQAEQYGEEMKKQLGLEATAQEFVKHVSLLFPQTSESALTVAAYVTFGQENEVTQSHPSLLSQLMPVAQNVPRILRRIVRKIPFFIEVLLSYPRSLFSHDVYVRKKTTKTTLRIALPILAIVIAASAFLFIHHMQEVEETQAAQAVIGPAEAMLTNIKNEVAQDPIQARTDVDALESQLQATLPKFEKQKIAQALIQQELNSVQEYAKNISGQEQLNALLPFYRLSSIQPDFLADKFDLLDKALVVVDSGAKRLVVLNTDTKEARNFSLSDLDTIRDFSLSDKSIFLLANGVYHVPLSTDQAPIVIRPAEDQNQNANGIEFYNNNLYVLNPAAKNIFRYTNAEDAKLASPSAWLRAPQTFDLNTVQSFSIDGDIWLSSKTGEIKRFKNGAEQDFHVTGLNDAFSSPITLFTKDSLDNLYVLEPQKQRLVILNKNGQFLREVKSQSLQTATSVVANEKTKMAYVLSGSVIYQIPL